MEPGLRGLGQASRSPPLCWPVWPVQGHPAQGHPFESFTESFSRSLSKVFSKTSIPEEYSNHRHLFLIAGAKPNWGTQVTNPTKSLRLWVLCDVNSNPARAGRGDAA